MERQLKKIKAGMKDEKDAIKYYKHFPKKGLTKVEKKHVLDAEKDEKEHLRYLKEDKETIGRMR